MPRARTSSRGTPSLAWQPAYGHVESTTCWYPCSYTLADGLPRGVRPGPLSARGAGRTYGRRSRAVCRCLESYLRDNEKTKCKWGMEWRIFPFLVFSEWGNSQTCWATLEICKNRAQRAMPGLKFDAQLHAVIDGQTATIFAPKWGWPSRRAAAGDRRRSRSPRAQDRARRPVRHPLGRRARDQRQAEIHCARRTVARGQMRRDQCY